jgi:hypothetical protein
VSANSPRSFLTIASKQKCSNLRQVTFYQSQVVVGSKTCSFVSQTIKYLTRRCSIVPLRSTGQLLSRAFVVLLCKSIPQSRNLKAAAELNVSWDCLTCKVIL